MQSFDITVNKKPVPMTEHRVTGLKVKEAAIAAGVDIQVDFQLSVRRPNGRLEVVNDDETVTVNKNSEFPRRRPGRQLVSPSTALSTQLVDAVDELRATFGDANVTPTPDGGGVWIRIDGIHLGSKWANGTTWLAFHVASTYPYADVYPHFVDASCTLAAGGLPPAVTAGARIPIHETQCLQVSRRSNRWDPTRDTAAAKALKVIDWLRAS